MNNKLKDILFIFPVMLYFLLEALIVGLIISTIWKFFLSYTFNFNIGYFQIVAIYWIIKMLLFDVFKLVAGLNSVGSNMEKEMEDNDEDNKHYNEAFTE